MFTKSATKRIVNATKWVESHSAGQTGFTSSWHQSSPLPWWGVTKDRINNQEAGDVYVVTGSALNPTTSTTIWYEVANPWMGDLIAGYPVMVVPAIVNGNTTGQVWHVAPFFLMYEGKVVSGITNGSSGSVEIWHDTDRNTNVTAHLRWVPNASDAAAGAQVRVVWDMFKRRFYIDAMEC